MERGENKGKVGKASKRRGWEGRERKNMKEEDKECTVSLQNSACFADLTLLMDLSSLLNEIWHLVQTFFNRGMEPHPLTFIVIC